MKKYCFILLLCSITGIAQSLDNFKYVIVPVKFESFKKENQYRLNTILKARLNQLGFVAFYNNETLPENVDKDRCNFLYANVVSVDAILQSKLQIVFTDCQNNTIYKSAVGGSRKKDYAESYQEALQNAFSGITYSYKESTGTIEPTKSKQLNEPIKVMGETNPASGKLQLKAEAIASGYLLIDESNSKVEFRLMKTSKSDVLIATRQQTQGVFLKKGDDWFFEFYQNGNLISEKIEVKLQ